MSRQSYINGFVKAASMRGVDAVELAKFLVKQAETKRAFDENNDTAGIGTWNDNSVGKAYPAGGGEYVVPPLTESTKPPRKDAYIPQLLENVKKVSDKGAREAALDVLGSVAPRTYGGGADSDIKMPDLSEMRARQADIAAHRYFGGLDAVKRYLIERGAANHSQYIGRNGKKVLPSKLDNPRLKQLFKKNDLDEKKLRMLEAIQNAMVMAKGVKGTGAVA